MEMSDNVKAYKILSKVVADEDAQFLAGMMDSKGSVATKEDLLTLKLDLRQEISNMKLLMIILWIATICSIIVTNPKALDLISRLCGMVK